MSNENTLEPIGPQEAKKMYLDQRESEVSESTIQAHHYRLKHFVHWCEEVEEIENLNELSGRDLQRYKMWRRDDGDLNNVTLVTQLSTLRVFIRWCENIYAVEEGLHDKILLPSLSKTEDRRDAMLDSEAAEQLLEYLRQFEFASEPMRLSNFCGIPECVSAQFTASTSLTTTQRTNQLNYGTGLRQVRD